MQLKNTMAGFPRFYNAFSSIALQQGYKFKSADESMDVYEHENGSVLSLDESQVEIQFGERKITKSSPKAALTFIAAMNQMTVESVPMLFMSHEDDGATGATLNPATPNLNPNGPAVPQYDNAYAKLMNQYGYSHAGAGNGGDLYTKSGMPDVEVGQDHVRFTDVKSMGVQHKMPDTYHDIASFTTALNEIAGGTTGTQTEVNAGPTNPDGVNTVKSEAPQVQGAGATSSNMKGESLEPRFKNRFSIVLESYGYDLTGRMGKADLYSKEGSDLSFKVTKDGVSAIVPQSESEMKVQAFESGSKLMAYLESHPKVEVPVSEANYSDFNKWKTDVLAKHPDAQPHDYNFFLMPAIKKDGKTYHVGQWNKKDKEGVIYDQPRALGESVATAWNEDAADGDGDGTDPAKKNQEVQAEQPENPGTQVDGAPAGMDQQTTPSNNVHQNVNGMEVQTTGGQQQMHQTPVNTENDPNHPVQSGQAVASPSPNGNVKAGESADEFDDLGESQNTPRYDNDFTKALTAGGFKFHKHVGAGQGHDRYIHPDHKDNVVDVSPDKAFVRRKYAGEPGMSSPRPFDNSKSLMRHLNAFHNQVKESQDGDTPPAKKDAPTDKDGDEVKIKVANADDALAKLKKAGVSADKCSDTCIQVDPKDEDKARKALNESFDDMTDVERLRSLTASYESKIEKFDTRNNVSESQGKKGEKVSTLRRLTGLLK